MSASIPESNKYRGIIMSYKVVKHRIYRLMVVFITLGILIYSIKACQDGSESRPDFSSIDDAGLRKQSFLAFMAPIVNQENARILQMRAEIMRLQALSAEGLSSRDVDYLADVTQRYKVTAADVSAPEVFDSLLRRIDLVPPSLALAQSANESGWGTSRFAQQGNNYFGQWCYEKGCGIVPSSRKPGASHEVAQFDSAADSVKAYLRNINSSRAYRKLRDKREKLRTREAHITGNELVVGLHQYSERGEEYIKDIKSMIRVNKLSQYDIDFVNELD